MWDPNMTYNEAWMRYTCIETCTRTALRPFTPDAFVSRANNPDPPNPEEQKT